MGSSSIVDIPKKPSETDLFGINRYSKGLIKFIHQSDTPITIAIQGEWGSGKTSLMNTIQYELCGSCETVADLKDHNKDFYSIWINTWQYSLLQSHEQTLVSIVLAVTSQVARIVSERHQTPTNKVFKSFYSIATKIGKGLASTAVEHVAGSKIAESVDELMQKEESNKSIKDLRDALQEVIDECIKRDHEKGLLKKGFLVFVDDLDRIDPPVAVQILELLKNIFDLERCIFILAIDYDVVIKGLKPKFGELTDKNEREFRSFFDKIIQMPFSMPVATYSIDSFLVNNLVGIGFLPVGKETNLTFTRHITTICNLSVGTNPRSLKRLLNTVSLINIISKESADMSGVKDGEDDYVLLLNFALICIQIAYPSLYKVLTLESDFKRWDQTLATNLNLIDLNDMERKKLLDSEEFDEEWEQILYRICKKDSYLSNKSVQVSQLFNLMAKVLPEGEDLGGTINELLALSSVTDVQAFDKPKQAINKGPVLKSLAKSIVPLLSKKLRPPYTIVRQQSQRVMTNIFLSYSPQNWKNWLGLSVDQVKDGLGLWLWYHPWAFKIQSQSMTNDIETAGLGFKLKELIDAYKELSNKYPDIHFKYEPMMKSGTAKGFHIPQITILYSFDTLSALEDKAVLDRIADIITDFMDCNLKLNSLIEQYASVQEK